MDARQTVGAFDQRADENDLRFVERADLSVPFGEVGPDVVRNLDQRLENTGCWCFEQGTEAELSAAILPDGSVVVQLASHTVHVDIRTRAIHLRAPSDRDELSGEILESFPLTAIDRVRVARNDHQEHTLQLALRSGRALPLGTAPTHELAVMTARIVADVTRCKLEVVGDGPQALPGPSEAFSKQPTMERRIESEEELMPTGRILIRGVVPRGPLPELAKAAGDEHPTEPPDDPLDMTMCRPASEEESAARIPLDEAPTHRPPSFVPPAQKPQTLSEGLDDTHIAKTKIRIAPRERVESWQDMHEEIDPTIEDAFDVPKSDWSDVMRP